MVPNAPILLVFLHANNFCGQFSAAARRGEQASCVVRLAAAGGIKCGPVELHAPEGQTIGAGNLLNVRHDCVETSQK